MEIPPPAVPDELLADWRQTDQAVDSPFSTPVISAYTHTVVYEESTKRKQVFERCGVDHPWQFFFASRIQLEPSQPPNPVLTSLIRNRVDRAFVERLSGRGLTQIETETSNSVSLGSTKARRFRYTARLDLDIESRADSLCLPIEASLVVWADEGYRLAGGAYPGRPTSGPIEVVRALTESIDPAAAREKLRGLIAGCVDR